jgi:hypothetical protein
MTVLNWPFMRLAFVAILWIALVALIEPYIGPRQPAWTMTAPDGRVQLSGVIGASRHDLIVATLAFGPPVVLVVIWLFKRR